MIAGGRLRRWALLALTCAAVVLVTWGSFEPAVALHGSGAFAENAEYPSRNAGAVRTRRYASWRGSDANAGSLESEPFRAGLAIAFFVDGYPSHDGESIYLERIADGARYAFAFARDPGERWMRVAHRLPPGWIGRAVRLRAVDASREHRGWIGIGGVRTTSLLWSVIDIENPWYAGGWAALAIIVFLACLPLIARGAGLWRRLAGAPAAFVTALAAATLYFRLPGITSGVVLNEDEAQMTAQAITFLHHPVPWLDVDGTTSGPLNSMIVALPALIGSRPTLASSRLVGALLVVVMLVCLYVAIARLWGDLAARVSVLLPLAVVCADTDGAYLQYASELLPIALSAVALMCSAELIARRTALPAAAGAAGVALGAMPFAKLQAAPLALVLGLACVAVLLTVAKAGDRRRSWLSFAGGVVAVPALMLTAVAARGGFDDFLNAYVTFPRAYVAGNCCYVAGLDFFLSDAPFAAFFLIAACLAAALAAGTAVVRREALGAGARKTYVLLGFCALMTLVALYTVEAPQTPFAHYLLFLVLPVSGIVATLLGTYLAALRASPRPRWILAVSVLVTAIASVVPIARGSLADNPFVDHDIMVVQPPADAAAPALEASIKPGQRVAMWGWMPQYLVYTGAVMGTRDSISQFQIEPRSFRAYYRARYLSDFLRNRPDFVIEAIGPNAFAYHDRATQGIASFAELKRILDASYRVVFDSNDVRLFVRSVRSDVRPGSAKV